MENEWEFDRSNFGQHLTDSDCSILRTMRDKPLYRFCDTFTQTVLGPESEILLSSANIEATTRLTVRLRRVPGNTRRKSQLLERSFELSL